MKMVKSLLLVSAAGVVAVSGAQAADLPVKENRMQMTNRPARDVFACQPDVSDGSGRDFERPLPGYSADRLLMADRRSTQQPLA